VVLRRRALAILTIVILAALVAWIASAHNPVHPRPALARRARGRTTGTGSSPDRFSIARLAVELPFALQDAAAVALGGERVALLGGLDATDTSTAAVSVLDARSVLAGGARLPEPQHDAQAALLDGRVYVFGGGQFGSYSHILAYDPRTGVVSQVASLPSATSDAGVAAIAGTAYVVGGFDGEHALDTIVAWRPGAAPAVVARLPYGLRYAAVAADHGRLLIAGGTRGEAASAAILAYDPATRAVREIGTLPSPVTHAAAVALGSYVYVLGGRGAREGTQTAAVVAIDAASGRATSVGALAQPRSDGSAALVGGRIWIAGGIAGAGAAATTVASVLELTPVAR
jgi:hypothetical protein